jgi:hypothetical protein
MHSLLESYLSKVAAHLSDLPIRRRNEEIREIRLHLLNAVTVSCETGQTEEEAAQNAIQQFGTPEDLSDNLVWAWRREQTLNKRSFWGAAVCTFALLFLVAFSEGPFIRAYFNPISTAHLPTAQYVLLAFELFGPLVAGTIIGILFSRKVIAGSAAGIVTYSILCLCVYAHWLVQPGHLQQLGLVSPATTAVRFLAPLVAEGLVALTAAWISSQLRLTWNKLRRLARA